MIAKVHGGFERFSGSLNYDKGNPEKSTVEATLEAGSINTKEPQRDAHLKSADFFDVEKFPVLTFRSTSIVANQGRLKLEGDLTIRDITRKVVLDVEGPSEELKDPWGRSRIGVSASTKISRKDFGLTWNAALEAGGVLVGDAVTINLDLQFVKQE